MNHRFAIVTGSSSGFGLLSAVELACSGYDVIATMRNPKKSSALMELAQKKQVEKKIHVHPLDVTSKESISQFEFFLRELPSIDVLVNNAGYACGGFSEELSLDDYRAQFETNLFGVIAVTQAVLPFMRTKQKGRIINISSISGRIGFPGLSAYASSKYAVEGYSESLRLEVKPFGIDVTLVEPGSYQTNIWSSVDKMEAKETSPYHSYMKSLLKIIHTGKEQHGNPADVAKLIARIATQPKTPRLRYPIGKSVKATILLKELLPWKYVESIIMKKVLHRKQTD